MKTRIAICILLLFATAACASDRFTCDKNGFKLNNRPFIPVGACYAVVTDLDFAGKYNKEIADKDLDICKDLNMNILMIFLDYASFEPSDDHWNDSYTSNVDDFIERAYKRGIYIVIGTNNWAAGFEFEKIPACEGDSRSDQRFASQIIMQESAKWTREFLTRLKNRDKLFAWVIFGEPATNAWASETGSLKLGFMAEYMKSGIITRWHDYLRRKYRLFSWLKDSWSLGGKIEAMRPEEVDFDTVRPAFEGDIHYYAGQEYPSSWRRSEDYQRFLVEEYTRNVNFLSDTVKSVDPDLMTCNSLLPVLLPVLRSWRWSIPEVHHGIAFPDRLIEPQVKTDFTAIRFSPDMDSWSESLSLPSMPIEYKLQFGLPAAIWYMKHALSEANKPLMFFDLDNADFGNWTPEMMRTYTSQELPLAFYAGANGYLWWDYKNNPAVAAPYGLVNDDRTPTSRYNVAKDFNKWLQQSNLQPATPEVTIIMNETDIIVNSWDTWASIEALSESLLSRGVTYEVITVGEFVSSPKTRSKVIWLRNGFADIDPQHPTFRKLMEDPKKQVLVIGMDRFISTEAEKYNGNLANASVNVFRSSAGKLSIKSGPFQPKAPFKPMSGKLMPIDKPAYISGKYGILLDDGKSVEHAVGLAVANVELPAKGDLIPLLEDSDGKALAIGDRKSPNKTLLLLQLQAIWYADKESGVLDLVPDLLGISRKYRQPGVATVPAKKGRFMIRTFGDPTPAPVGLTFNSEGKLVHSDAPLKTGEVRLVGK